METDEVCTFRPFTTGGVSLRGICIFSEQCTGTQNAGTCLYYNEERENVCSCDQGFFEEGEKCLEGSFHKS